MMDYIKEQKARIAGAVAVVGAFLAATPKAFAQAITPVPVAVPTEAKQLAADGVHTIYEAFVGTLQDNWPTVLGLIVLFLGIRYAMSMIFRRSA